VDIGATQVEFRVLERLHGEGLEEARSIQTPILPTEALHAGSIEISHEFQPVTAVGGDFLDDFELLDGRVGKGTTSRNVCGQQSGMMRSVRWWRATISLRGASNVCCLRVVANDCAICAPVSRCRTLNDSQTRLRVSEASFG
jgi:hypothetical protein